jgi:putative transposase
MYGKGRFLDNIFIERLWRNLIYECPYLHAWETGSGLKYVASLPLGIMLRMTLLGNESPTTVVPSSPCFMMNAFHAFPLLSQPRII